MRKLAVESSNLLKAIQPARSRATVTSSGPILATPMFSHLSTILLEERDSQPTYHFFSVSSFFFFFFSLEGPALRWRINTLDSFLPNLLTLCLRWVSQQTGQPLPGSEVDGLWHGRQVRVSAKLCPPLAWHTLVTWQVSRYHWGHQQVQSGLLRAQSTEHLLQPTPCFPPSPISPAALSSAAVLQGGRDSCILGVHTTSLEFH